MAWLVRAVLISLGVALASVLLAELLILSSAPVSFLRAAGFTLLVGTPVFAALSFVGMIVRHFIMRELAANDRAAMRRVSTPVVHRPAVHHAASIRH
jgi:quinol-cytochrome oxidoreductase complex cytochrome b subunit